jgi:hypothetical protein
MDERIISCGKTDSLLGKLPYEVKNVCVTASRLDLLLRDLLYGFGSPKQHVEMHGTGIKRLIIDQQVLSLWLCDTHRLLGD